MQFFFLTQQCMNKFPLQMTNTPRTAWFLIVLTWINLFQCRSKFVKNLFKTYVLTSWGDRIAWLRLNSICQKPLSKMVFCYRNCFDLLWEKIVLVIEKKYFEIRSWRQKICKSFEITRTICLNSERSEQLLVTECFSGIM